MSTLGRSRSSRTATETEEKPAETKVSAGSRRTSEKSGNGKTRGWGAYGTIRRTNSLDDRLLSLDEGVERVVKFVEAEPFDNYLQHFLNALPKGVKKSYVAARDSDPDQEDCDICAEGDPPSTYSLFNVIDLGPLVEDGDEFTFKPQLVAWRTSPATTDKIRRISESRRTSPINREDLYFAVLATKNKSGFLMVEKVEGIKTDDLESDTGIPPLDDAAYEKFASKAYTNKSDVGVKDDSDEAIQEALEKLPASD